MKSKQPKSGNLLGILAFLRRYPLAISLSLGILLANLGIEMLLPQILGSTLDQLRAHADWEAPFDPAPVVLLFASLVLIRTGSGILLGPIRNRLVQQTLGDIRAAVYNAIQRHAFTFHDRSSTGELISRATTDVWRLQDFLFACLFLSLDILLAMIIAIGLIFVASPLLGWAALATIVPSVALIAHFARHLQPQWRKVHDLHGAMTTVVQENIAGVRVVRAFAREDGEIAKFRRRREEFLGTLFTTVQDWATRVPLAQFVFGLSIPTALGVGGWLVIHHQLALGNLAVAIFYLMAIGHRMGQVGQLTNIIQNASASAERILEILQEPPAICSGPRDLPAGQGALTFDHVSFRYGIGHPSLTDVTFEASPGKVIAIVGPTGAGKSTLVHLIPRFYDPVEGAIRLDGVDLRELKLEALRQQVGMIFQETYLFSTTVAENIAYGRPQATLEEIQTCAEAAQAHEFILQLDQRYDTVVGERGVNLSGGQKQRIAIARAFLRNPRILILDDATASVDAHTERLIQEAMRRLVQGRTTFVIAHRFATVQHADLILVLREGRIVEKGTHQELLGKGGFYRELFERQLQPGAGITHH